MAIKPDDLYKLTPEDVIVVKKFEEEIDKKLLATYEPGKEFKINLAVLVEVTKSPFNYKVKQDLIRRYVEAGWEIQIDNHSIVFSLPGQKKSTEKFEEVTPDELNKRIQAAQSREEGPISHIHSENPYYETGKARKAIVIGKRVEKE